MIGANREKLPPIPSELRKEVQKYTAECVERLAHLVRSPDPKVSLKAAELLLAYAHGPVTPAEELEGERSRPIRMITDDMTPQEAAEVYRQSLQTLR